VKFLTHHLLAIRYINNMKVMLYHEIDPSTKDNVLNQGIKRGAEGRKNDAGKKKVDAFLDTHMPDWAKEKQLSRHDAVYGYLVDGDKIVDITNGESVAVEQFIAKSHDALLRVMVDSDKCYVSDLDLYDTIIRAMELDEQDSTREHLADRYWERIVPLEKFELGMFARPEVIVTTDIEPRSIEVVKG
jgi:hypothetical protein